MPSNRASAGGWAHVLALVIAVVLVTHGGIAAAQSVDSTGSMRLRLGPVSVAPTFELRDIGVDTNVYNDSSSDPTKDFVLTAIPTFVATMGSARRGLTVRSVTSLVYFAQQASERSVNEDLTLSTQATFGRFTPSAGLSYLNTRERVSFEVDARARRVEQRVTGGLRFAVTPKISADIHGEFWENSFDGNAVYDTFGLAAELNRESNMLGATVDYKLTPLTSFNFVAEASAIRFKEASLRDTDTRQMLVGVTLNPRALISGSARVGYQRFRPLSPLVPEFNGVVGNATVSYRVRSRTTVGFTFDRRTDFSYYVVEPYYVQAGYGLSLRRQIVPQWDAEVTVSRSAHNYLRLLQPANDEAGHDETLLSTDLNLGYDVGPRTRLTVGLRYEDRHSDFITRGYDGVRVGVSMFYGF
jgi:hypothetical protein